MSRMAHMLIFGTPTRPAREEMLTTRGTWPHDAEWASKGKKACRQNSKWIED